MEQENPPDQNLIQKANGNKYCSKCGVIVTTLFITALFVVVVALSTALVKSNSTSSNGNLGGGEAQDPFLACSSRGVFSPDTQQCECFEPFTGNTCQLDKQNFVITATSGQPYLMQEYWLNFRNQVHQVLAPVTYELYYRVPYQLLLFGPYTSQTNATGIARPLLDLIRSIHRKYNNVKDIDNYSIIFGVGARLLTAASYYAYSKVLGKPVNLFVRTPYYMSYGPQCDLFSPFCNWTTNTTLDPSQVLEFVTIPNNPDGFPRIPVYPQAKIGYDLVYYWPSLQPDPLTPHDGDILYFSFTKMSGHASTRFGWAFVKDPVIAKHMGDYIQQSIIHLSVDTCFKALETFQYINNSGDLFFNWMRTQMQARWERLLPLFENQTNFILRSRPNTAYAWIECVNITNAQCQQIFTSAGILGYTGERFGIYDKGFIRINLTLHSATFDILLKYLAQILQNK